MVSGSGNNKKTWFKVQLIIRYVSGHWSKSWKLCPCLSVGQNKLICKTNFIIWKVIERRVVGSYNAVMRYSYAWHRIGLRSSARWKIKNRQVILDNKLNRKYCRQLKLIDCVYLCFFLHRCALGFFSYLYLLATCSTWNLNWIFELRARWLWLIVCLSCS